MIFIGTKEILQAREIIKNAGGCLRIEEFDDEYKQSGRGQDLRLRLLSEKLAYEDGDFIYSK